MLHFVDYFAWAQMKKKCRITLGKVLQAKKIWTWSNPQRYKSNTFTGTSFDKKEKKHNTKTNLEHLFCTREDHTCSLKQV